MPPMVPCGVALLLLNGCVVQEMHDDLAATRAGVEGMADLAPELRQSNAALAQSIVQLERMYGELARTNTSLALVLDKLTLANSQMEETLQELRHLDPMSASIQSVDESLAALRKTIENIDKAVPLINLTAGTPPADRALKRQDAARGNESPAAVGSPR